PPAVFCRHCGMACTWRPVARRFASQCVAQDPREPARVPCPRSPRPQRGTNDQPGGPEGAEPRMSQPAQDTAATAPSHPQQQEMPLAVVHGQPVLQIPQDLYIPPDALEVILEAFEGPLDLLLYLIRRQNLDILDIPVAEITRQYVDYISVMQELRFELAAEYLVMAAILAEIKSRMLLPRPPSEEGEEEDP